MYDPKQGPPRNFEELWEYLTINSHDEKTSGFSASLLSAARMWANSCWMDGYAKGRADSLKEFKEQTAEWFPDKGAEDEQIS